jgi:hypothetical protein
VAVRAKKRAGNAIYGIRRVDNDKTRTHCYIVCIQRRGRIWRRCFSDGVYEGKANALQAAKAYRDGIVADNPPLTRAEYAAIKRRNNISGVPGICRYAWIEMTSGGKPVERPYWIAFWSQIDGRRVGKKFSIDKYGEKGAYDRARAARRKGMEALRRPYVNSSGFRNWLRRHPDLEPKAAKARGRKSPR